MVILPDVNVLIALAWPTHIHHDAVHQWFGERPDQPWATCPATQSGFVRVSSNRAVIPAAKSPWEAVQALEAMVGRPHHVFWADDLSIADRRWVAVEKLIGFRQVTDAHLLGLALKNGGQLLTLDRAIAGLVPSAFDRQQALAFIV